VLRRSMSGCASVFMRRLCAPYVSRMEPLRGLVVPSAPTRKEADMADIAFLALGGGLFLLFGLFAIALRRA
jgi:hypothetical protein